MMFNIIGSLGKPCVLKIQVSTNYKIHHLATCIKCTHYAQMPPKPHQGPSPQNLPRNLKTFESSFLPWQVIIC